MHKKYLLAALLSVVQFSVVSAQKTADSLEIEKMSEVVVNAVKTSPNAPFAVTNIGKKVLEQFSGTGQELPLLLSQTPGIVAWSENGVGTGTTYMRIRGAGDSRINVTLDGVPLNSPEDQCVFWANMNSYASLLKGIQVQRGVGTSTNGDGAFGGNIALQSKSPSHTPMAELSGSYGSYNTFNVGGAFSTGLLWKHVIFDGAYHETNTDGYLHGTSGRSGSYYGGLAYINSDNTFVLRYKNFGNFEKTGQAWNGVTAGNDDYSLNVYNGIRTYEDMYKSGLGRFNSLYERFVPNDDGTWSLQRYQKADGTNWDKTTDNFWQNHNILSAAWTINNHWSATSSLHYTYGYGYYKEFRYKKKLSSFGLESMTDTQGNKISKSNFVRKKGLDQNTGGILWNINYRDDNWDIISGMSVQLFGSNHFGYLTYVGNETVRNMVMANGDYKYYTSDATKNDANAYIKATYHIDRNWELFGDMQYRYVTFFTTGYNDKFIVDNVTKAVSKHYLNVNKEYNFLNPKAGFSFHKNGHHAYASYALAHREPERNNFTDNGYYPSPKEEILHDFEVGYNYNCPLWYIGLNMYYMYYHNQFVQTGLLSDIGEKLTTNIDKSYRCGVEVSAGIHPTSWLTIEGNAALSRNRIKNFDEAVETYDNDWNSMPETIIHYNSGTLAFSPSAILNGVVKFHHKGLEATWHTNYVSRQYLDNTKNTLRSLPEFSVSNIRLGYDLRINKGVKDILFGVNFNNIFNKHYASSGWVYSSIVGNTHPNDNRYYQIGYIPMAGFTAMGNITLRF